MSSPLPDDGPTTPALAWRVHHVIDGGPGTWALGLVLVGLIPLTLAGIGEGSLAFLVLVVFFWSLREFWLPHDYALTEAGITVETPFAQQTEPWSRYRGHRLMPRGILLTRLSRPSVLDACRGRLLVTPSTMRPAVADFVARRLVPTGPAAPPTATEGDPR